MRAAVRDRWLGRTRAPRSEAPVPGRRPPEPWGVLEALLLAAGVATAVFAIEVVMQRRALESYGAVLRIGGTGLYLWLEYLLVYAVFGGMMAAAARAAGLRRPLGLLATFLGLMLPPLLYAAAFPARIPLTHALSATSATVIGAALALCGVAWAAALERRWLGRFARAGLVTLVLSIGAVMHYATGWRSARPLDRQLPELGLLGGMTAAAALVSAAALWQAAGRRARGRLAAACGVFAVFLAGALMLETGSGPRPARSTPGAAATPPPVLLIVADTLRADFVSALGGAPGTTPNLDELARDGIVFENAHAPAPWTTPSFGSILSSTYPSEHGAGRIPERGMRGRLDPSLRTLPEVLARRGYATVAVLSNIALGHYYGLTKGFHRYLNYHAVEWYHPIAGWLENAVLFALSPHHVKGYLTAGQQTVRHLDALGDLRATGRPWLLLAHYMDPHRPYAPGRFVQSTGSSSRREAYRAEVRRLDRAVGVLLDDLRRHGEYRRAVVAFVADHGEELSEDRIEGDDTAHGHTLFEEAIHVPMILKLPGNRRAGARRPDSVSLVDVAPTILGALGIAAPPTFRGANLLDVDPSPAPGRGRTVFAEMMLKVPEQKAAIRSRKKVVLGSLPPDPEEARAYDLAADPEERQPVPLPEAEGDFQALYRTLARRVRESGDSSEDAMELDPVHRSQLEALGYAR